jgi:GAF domain-containing protein
MQQAGRPDDPQVVRRLDEVSSALSDLREILDREEGLGPVLQRSVEQVARAMPGATMASVSVLRGKTAETVAASNDRVVGIDHDQYATGEGPCLEAARTGQMVRVSVERASQRWPEFARSARRAGVESYLSCPLFLDEEFAGSLNLYSDEPHGFGELDEALLRLYVTAAAAAIANARRYAQARRLAEQLGQALDSRAVIDQARGVLMAIRGITAEQALDELSRQSQNTNTKLRDIAARLVEGTRRPAP